MENKKGFLKSLNLVSQITIFFLIIFFGCATKGALKNVSDEEVLREKVMAYWNYKVKKEFDKSYEFEDPLFRQKINMVSYIKGFNTAKAEWSAAEIAGLKIEDDTASVDMKLRVKMIVTSPKKPISLEQDAPIKEKWVKVDGIWYHVPQKFRERQSAN